MPVYHICMASLAKTEKDKPKRLGVVRDMPRFPIEPQKRELLSHGCYRVIELGPDWASWVNVLETLRKSDELVVRHLHLLPPPRLSTSDSRRRFLFRCLRELQARGNSWYETSTGTVCTDTQKKLTALENAIEFITNQAHGLNRRKAQKNGKLGGSVADEFSAEALRKAFETYTDPRLTGEALDAALEAIKSDSRPIVGFSTARCYRMFGGRTTAKFNDGKR
jgi:hypothetical protein